MTKPTVLVIDDRRHRLLLHQLLTRRGYRTLLAPDGQTGLSLLEQDVPDLVLLDLLLPDMEGHEVCRCIWERSPVPIIILSARAAEAHKVRALRLGADDYVTKPFGAEELLARVAAVLRRRQGGEAGAPAMVVSGELVVDLLARRVILGGEEVHLAPAEYELLRHLARNVGRPLIQEELLRRGWGPGYKHQRELLHTTLRRLRRKLEPDPAAPRFVLTRRTIGYVLPAPSDPAAS